jgi:hypothetical protein
MYRLKGLRIGDTNIKEGIKTKKEKMTKNEKSKPKGEK